MRFNDIPNLDPRSLWEKSVRLSVCMCEESNQLWSNLTYRKIFYQTSIRSGLDNIGQPLSGVLDTLPQTPKFCIIINLLEVVRSVSVFH